MTRTEQRLLVWLAILLAFVGGAVAGSCSARGAGTLTRVFAFNSQMSTLWLRYECGDRSWREEAIFIGNPTSETSDSMLLRFAAATNAAGKGE